MTPLEPSEVNGHVYQSVPVPHVSGRSGATLPAHPAGSDIRDNGDGPAPDFANAAASETNHQRISCGREGTEANGQTATVRQFAASANVPSGPSAGGKPIRATSRRVAERAMKKRLGRGKKVIVLTTYESLRHLAGAVADGLIPFLILVGNPGLGKTRTFRDTLGEKAHILHGRVSPIHLHIEAYRHRGQILGIDDVHGLLDNPAGVDYLKDFFQTEPIRAVSWLTATKVLEEAGVPREYTLSRPGFLITNNLPRLEEKLPALADRAQLTVFDPPPLEIHQAAVPWCKHQEVFDYIGDHLHLIRGLTLRTYDEMAGWKTIGYDWRSLLVDGKRAQAGHLVAQLKADPGFRTEEDRVRRFIELGAGKRTTYFDVARQLKKMPSLPPRIRLPNADPPSAA